MPPPREDDFVRTPFDFWPLTLLTHWGRVMHICVSTLTTIGSDNGLSPGRRQAIIWTNAGILFIRPLGTNFSEISIGIQTFSFKKMHLKVSSAKWRPFCLGLSVLNVFYRTNAKQWRELLTPEVEEENDLITYKDWCKFWPLWYSFNIDFGSKVNNLYALILGPDLKMPSYRYK